MFDGSYRYEMSKLKLILDGLLNAGMPQYLSVLEYSYSRNIALVVSLALQGYMSLITRKPVFKVFDQVRHKPACTATEAS